MLPLETPELRLLCVTFRPPARHKRERERERERPGEIRYEPGVRPARERPRQNGSWKMQMTACCFYGSSGVLAEASVGQSRETGPEPLPEETYVGGGGGVFVVDAALDAN